MTPSNPTNQQPFIYRVADAAGVFHLVAPVDHTHTISEVAGLESALSTINTTLAAKANAAAVETALEGKQNTLTFDSTPTANSTNPVTSGGVKAALDGKTGISRGNNGWVEVKDNGQVEIIGDQSVYIGISDMDGALVTLDNIANLKRALLNPDSTPTANSDKLVTSGGIRTALNGKMPVMTIDETPTENSGNLVSSGGVKAALDGKANTIHTHIASQVEGVMPYYLTYDGDSINLDDILTDPHTMQRLIIENASGFQLDMAEGLFTSPTDQLVIHINDTPELFIVEPGDYAMVTIFKVDRGETAHGHDLCYFAYVEGIFNQES